MVLEDNPNNHSFENEAQKTKQVSTKQKISSLCTALSKGPSAFQLKFKDRYFAANILAAIIQNKGGKDLKKNKDNVVVLGVPRGGIVVADIVA
jgi:hypothetical protein